MAEIFLSRQAREFPGQRVALWAHDYHLSMAHDVADQSFPARAITLGTVLADELGASYAPFAISAVDIGINWFGVGEGPMPRAANGVEDALDALIPLAPDAALFVDATADVMQSNDVQGWGYDRYDLRANFRGLFVLRTSPGMDALYW
jgi:hypothetical protein